MERYNKYLVLKNEDVAKHLSDEKQLKLDALVTNIRVGRLKDGKRDQEYVVVAADWPMYETVWGLIEAFVDNKPNEIDQLRARVAELEEQLDTHKKLSEAAISDNARWVETLTKKLMLAKDVIKKAAAMTGHPDVFNYLQEALAAINDSKLVEGLILCDAKPVAYADLYGNVIRKDTKEFSRNVLTNDFSRPLYAPRRTEK